MAVYVDSARNRLGRMIMSHMTADTIEELHRAASQVGLRRSWFQDHGNHYHYDLCQQKRLQLIENGAIVVSTRELAKRARTLKGKESA